MKHGGDSIVKREGRAVDGYPPTTYLYLPRYLPTTNYLGR